MKILGVKVDSVTLEQSVARVCSWLQSPKKRIFTIVTPNPEIIVQAQRDRKLAKILNSADLAVPDGVGLRFAGVRHIVPGVKLMEELCQVAARNKWTVGLYGGRGGVGEETRRKLREKYKGLKVWVRNGAQFSIFNFQFSNKNIVDEEIDRVRKKVEKTKTRLLFIGLGAPKQEYFMQKLKAQSSKLNSKRSLGVMAVGGSFDEISGKVKPAPGLIRKLGLKWLWRLIWQPWRIKRQLRLVKFVYLVIRKKYLASRVSDAAV